MVQKISSVPKFDTTRSNPCARGCVYMYPMDLRRRNPFVRVYTALNATFSSAILLWANEDGTRFYELKGLNAKT